MPLTLPEIAAILNVSLRQAQRYASGGYRGHVLPTVKVGHSQVVDSTDFEQWLKLTGLGAKGTPEPGTPEVPGTPEPAPELSDASGASHPTPLPSDPRPGWCRPSDPNAPLTNCPSEHSSNWCSDAVMRKHYEEDARRLVAQFKRSGAQPHEYEDFEI